MPTKQPITIYTDGACKGNPGPGGWGVVLIYADTTKEVHKKLHKELHGGCAHTTNNRMELQAAIEALSCLTRPCVVNLYTDSTYVQQGISSWIKTWRANGWKTANKKPVRNKDLWLTLDELLARHSISWHWVKAHAGNLHNERADELANLGIKELAQ